MVEGGRLDQQQSFGVGGGGEPVNFGTCVWEFLAPRNNQTELQRWCRIGAHELAKIILFGGVEHGLCRQVLALTLSLVSDVEFYV